MSAPSESWNLEQFADAIDLLARMVGWSGEFDLAEQRMSDAADVLRGDKIAVAQRDEESSA